MVGRSKLYAWGVAGACHVLGLAVIASHTFDRQTLAAELSPIELAIVLPALPAPRAEPDTELQTPRPEPPTPSVAKLQRPEPNIETKRPEESVEPAPVPAPTVLQPSERRVHRRIIQRPARSSPSASAPYYETPPSAVQQTVRAFQCARLSPAQRVNCPSTNENDGLISAMVAEARSAAPIYDPVLNVYRTRTLLDRMSSGPPQPGAFSTVENASHVQQDSTGGTNGLSARLNANPDPIFDGGRYENWDSNAGSPGKN